MHERALTVTALVALVFIFAPLTANALDPAPTCEAGKLKTAGKYGACRLSAESKAVKKGEGPDYSKCTEKFSDQWQKAEEKAGPGVCPSEGDESSMDTRITDHANEVAALLGGGPSGYLDCGDGTVADSQTGLMWQKTDDAGGLTDRDNTYSWSVSFDAPDGTAFTEFLYGLNDCESADGVTVTGGYAGHCDWRMPQIDELQTILLEPFPCGTVPCIDESVFGPTASSGYWSASADNFFPVLAWFVDFFNGFVFNGNKFEFFDLHVRAVRAGSCP
jgi:hypothetical protein